MVAVWRVNGRVYCDLGRERSIQLLSWLDPVRDSWGWRHFSDVYRVVSWFNSDSEITSVAMADSLVNDKWLVHLQAFRNLKSIGLHDRQVGTGIGDLWGFEKLSRLQIVEASNGHLIELKRLPQLEDLSVWNPQPGDIGLDALTSLPKLKSLFFGNCPHANELLKSLPNLPLMETLVIQDCHGFTDDDLELLHRLPNLKYLDIVKSSPVSDAGLIHLSQLENLETLAVRKSSGEISDRGLRALQQLKKLKELFLISGDLTPAQLQSLNQLLPNVKIQVN